MTIFVIGLLVFAAVSSAAYLLLLTQFGGALRVSERLHLLATPAAAQEPTFASAPSDRLPTISAFLEGSDRNGRLQRELLRAGWPLRPAEFLGLCAGSALGCALAASATRAVWLMGLIGILGGALPWLILRQKQDTRRRRFGTLLPDALTLLSGSLRVGHSLDTALHSASEELPPPVSEEFRVAASEIRLGLPSEIALQRIGERVRSTDWELVFAAMVVQLQSGGNLAALLLRLAETLRERQRIQGETQTLTAEGRLSALILLGLAPTIAVLLLLRNPAYFYPLLSSSIGRLMLGGAIAGQIIGGWICHRLIPREV